MTTDHEISLMANLQLRLDQLIEDAINAGAPNGQVVGLMVQVAMAWADDLSQITDAINQQGEAPR